MHQQLWGYKIEEKVYLGVRETKRLNIAAIQHILLFNSRVNDFYIKVFTLLQHVLLRFLRYIFCKSSSPYPHSLSFFFVYFMIHLMILGVHWV
jgi:hypothetical protein